MASAPATDRAGQQRQQRKTRDRALVLVIAGFLLLMPPFVGIFEIEAHLFGVPVALVYLFTVWAGLIVGAARLAASLRVSEDRTGAGGS